MSYRRSRIYAPLGVTPSEAIRIAGDVITDPCFGDVMTSLKRIRAAHKAAVGPKGAPSPPSAPGIGLCKVKTPLKTYAGLVEHGSWVPGAVVVGAVVGIFALGYWSGKGKRR